MYALTIPHQTKPGTGDAYIAALAPFMDTEASAHGNLSWQLSRDEDDPDRFVLYEQWPSREVFEAFARTEVFKAFIGRMMGEWLAAPPTPLLYRVVGGSGEGKGNVRGI